LGAAAAVEWKMATVPVPEKQSPDFGSAGNGASSLKEFAAPEIRVPHFVPIGRPETILRGMAGFYDS
jgi:hypothetical protein